MKTLILTLLGLGLMAQPELNESQLAASQAAYWLDQGILVDGSQNVMYLANENGQVVALTPEGQTAWTYEKGIRPLGIYGDWLIVQEATGNRTLLCRKLNRQTGETVGNTFQTGLSAGVKTLAQNGMNERFRIDSQFVDGALFGAWRFESHQVGGMMPANGIVSSTELDGFLQFEFSESRDMALPIASIPADREQAPQSVLSWAANRNTVTQLDQLGDQWFWAALEQSGSDYSLVLQQWNSEGEPASPLTLVNYKPLVTYVSNDKRHIIVSRRVAPGQINEYEWQIFDVTNGESVGTIRDPFSFGFLFVHEGTMVTSTLPYSRRIDGVLNEYPRRIRCIDLDSGNLLWDFEVLDPNWKGALPP